MSESEILLEYVLDEESVFIESRLDVSKNTSFEELELPDSPPLENESEEEFKLEPDEEFKEESHEDENLELQGENASVAEEIDGSLQISKSLISEGEESKNDGLLDGTVPLAEVSSGLKDNDSTIAVADKAESMLDFSIRLEQKTCMKDRMRQWLNRDRRQSPAESFLGMKYVDIEKLDDVDGVCRKLVCSSADDENVEAEATDDEWKTQESACSKKSSVRKLCACHLKEPQKSPIQLCKCGRKTKHVARKAKRVIAKLRKLCKRRPHRLRYSNKIGSCACHKTVRTFNRDPHSRRKTGKCPCDRLDIKRQRFLRTMRKKRNKELDRLMIKMEDKLRNDKIEALLKTIDPETASHVRKMAAENKATKKRHAPNTFVRMVRKKFGNHLRGYRMDNLKKGILRRGYDENDTGFQFLELPNGSLYYGQFSPLGMEGKCVYKMAHGPVFYGTMVDGKMEGPGKLFYPNGGTIEGIWVSGSLFSPKYSFNDGLEFKSKGWMYCRMPDRRFFSEILNGMHSPDNMQLCADHPARQIPDGCLDAGQGFYDPKKKAIIHSSTGKIVRIVREEEGNWIMHNCRREQFEEVPFSRYMYENWYPGTVFPPPNDEPEWFDQEFPKLALPYSNIDDVVEARRMMIRSAIETSNQDLV